MSDQVDPLAVAWTVSQALADLGIVHTIGGSLAASLAGELFVRVSDGNGRVLFASLPQSDPLSRAGSIENGDRALVIELGASEPRERHIQIPASGQ